ncbi:MAG: hypothetical protein ABIZ80_06510 [Bryobacteraceae bacterium]
MTVFDESAVLPAIRFQLCLLRLGSHLELMRVDRTATGAVVEIAAKEMDRLREFVER